MPTKRTPIARDLRAHLSPELLVAFKRATELQPIRDGCDDGRKCRSKRRNVTCPECEEHSAQWFRVYELLGLKPWNVSPLDVSLDDDPAEDSNDAQDIAQAIELRRQILAAIAEAKGE